MDICVIDTLNRLFITGSDSFFLWNQIPKNLKRLVKKLRFLCQDHFVLPILFLLTLTFDRAVFHGNIAFSIAVLSTKKNRGKYAELSTKRSAILKFLSNVFRETYVLSVGLKMKKAMSVLTSKRFPLLRLKPIQILQ